MVRNNRITSVSWLKWEFLEENLNDEINNKFYLIENEIDIRIESIVTDLHKYRDELRDELNLIKTKFIK